MITKKKPDPVEHMLASLDEGPEIENYAPYEIEALPIEEVHQRLYALGIDTYLPGYIKSLTASYPSPAQKLLDSLDDDIDQLSPEEIEHLTSEDVRAKLNSVGLNYLAGINEVRKLTGATSDGQQHEHHSLQSFSRGIWTRMRMAVVGSPRRRGLPLLWVRTLLKDLPVPIAVSAGVALALPLSLLYFALPNTSKPASQVEIASNPAPTAAEVLSQIGQPPRALMALPRPRVMAVQTTAAGLEGTITPAALPRTKPDTAPDIRGSVSAVESTSRIKVGSQWLDLYGINDPIQGAHTQDVLGYLRSSRGVVDCYQKGGGRYQCYADGKDLALLALRDGLAQAMPDAPSEYLFSRRVLLPPSPPNKHDGSRQSARRHKHRI